MEGLPRPTPPGAVPEEPTSLPIALRQLRAASWSGLVGQVLIWGSVVTLWILGSVFADIPTYTSLAYGAYDLTVRAATLFLLNVLLILGAVGAVPSLLLAARGLQKIASAPRRIDLTGEIPLATIGAIGFGMFAAGWALWLGSFAPPGSVVNPDPSVYAPVLAANLGGFVDLLLFVGGVLAFIGMLGLGSAAAKVGAAYEETAVEVGGVLSTVPLLSILGSMLSLVGLHRVERKVEGGWVPPPPAPPPVYLYRRDAAWYGGDPSIAPPPRPGSWDTLAAVLVICLVVVWALILPLSWVLSSSPTTHGPGTSPGGSPSSPGPAAATGPSITTAILFIAVVATALIVPVAVVRNRRKRQRALVRAAPSPPPSPPPAPPPVTEADPLDHLV